MNGDSFEVELPRGIALAWGVAVNPQRGPKRELSIEGIVDVAVTLADEGGLPAVSMSSVAATLGFTTMSLYRYVSAKDDLLLLMQESGTGLPPRRIAEADTWRDGLTAFAEETLATYLAHPWLLDMPIRGIPNTPNNLAWMDAGLAALRDTPLDWSSRVASVLLVTGQTRFQALIERGYADRSRETGVAPNDNDLADAHILGNLVTEDAFPQLFAALRSGVFSDEDNNPFTFGLGRALDGIERLIDNWHGSAPDPVGWEPPATDAFPRDEVVTRARQARREAEIRLRDAQRRETEVVKKARERQSRKHDADARAALKAAAKSI
ncbi:AcrR family transcriptional regulator [Mycetocola sp. CAN_C7]|uniref:TetR/AcrR family transcriptional regulator n=1 Tax=Mycetocola sp. CAN_C7 TaxID=2787724 RepID=UPI0018CBC093